MVYLEHNKITDRLWLKAGQEGFPLTAAFELLPLCNLHCKMCYVRKEMPEVRAAGGLIPGAQWLDWARQAQELGLLFPLLTGGEPLLHPDFRQIYTGLLGMGMQVSVNSNGTLIDRETAAFFGRNPPTRINMTLYGASEQTYQDLCGDGSAFGRVRNAVQYLKEAGVRVKFNASITPENQHDLEALMEYAHSVDSPIQVATYMFPPYRSRDLVGQNDRLTPEQAGYMRAKADWLQSDPKWFLGQTARFARFVPLDQLGPLDAPQDSMRMICRAGNSSMWIDWKGTLSNCGMYGSVELPLAGRPLAETWAQLRDQTRALRYAPACTDCPNRILCHPCIAMVHNECGDVNGRPEYLCRMNQASAQYYREFAETYYPEQAQQLFQPDAPAPQVEARSCDLEEF